MLNPTGVFVVMRRGVGTAVIIISPLPGSSGLMPIDSARMAIADESMIEPPPPPPLA